MSSATVYPAAPRAFTHDDAAPDSRGQNVSENERILSVLAGGVLGAAGAARGSLGGLGLMLLGGSAVYRGMTGHCAVYQALGVDRSGYDKPAVGVRAQHGLRYQRSLVIQDTPQALYGYWRQLENLPLIMRHLLSVTQKDSLRSRWVARGPLGTEIEWDAEIINERPAELIAWRSIPGSELDSAGSIHFQTLPGNRGTALRVELKYDPPGGQVVAAITRWLGAGLESSIDEDLQRFKQMREAGEIPSIGGQPQGRCRL